MAVKTITIDMEAYEALSRRKRPGQSFSQVIKEHFKGRGITGRDLLDRVQGLEVSGDFLDAMERIVADRQRDPVEIPDL